MVETSRAKGSFRELKVWQKARELALDVYRVTTRFPRHETYGLAAQMRSAAVSVPANVAEGKGRVLSGDFARFLRIAAGSLAELETYFDIAEPLGYLATEDRLRLQATADEVGKMLYGLLARLQAPDSPSRG